MRTKRIVDESVPRSEPNGNGQAPAGDTPKPADPASVPPGGTVPTDAPAPGDAFEGDGRVSTDASFEPDQFGQSSADAPVPPPPPEASSGGLNLDDLALPDDYETEVDTGSETTVLVRKASGVGFFRAHPQLWKAIRMLDIKEGADRGFYLVGGDALTLLQRLADTKVSNVRLFPARLTLCFGRDVGLFFWPLRLPQPRKENQEDKWATTALRVCKIAEAQWVEMFCPQGAPCYRWNLAPGLSTEPPWPSLGMNELAGIAFEGKHLTDPEDPVIRRRLGKE
jgi:hypothetical protein